MVHSYMIPQLTAISSYTQTTNNTKSSVCPHFHSHSFYNVHHHRELTSGENVQRHNEATLSTTRFSVYYTYMNTAGSEREHKQVPTVSSTVALEQLLISTRCSYVCVASVYCFTTCDHFCIINLCFDRANIYT